MVTEATPTVKERFNFQVGDIIPVSNIYSKKKINPLTEGSPNKAMENIIGKYYSEEGTGVTVLAHRGTEIKGHHGEIWNVKITKVLDRCIIGEWVEFKDYWKKNRR